ncbi:hypothetical protein J1605_008721 [Eschrichtius robustus]|uniref:Uncharacterized protein n=1 Tax=Eschrichtius robustus TaxID=9764 RepID=A0AB34GU94_ESCRO|nr:hypothetical protein J1605_008721 [Eschrichtius robustus]
MTRDAHEYQRVSSVMGSTAGMQQQLAQNQCKRANPQRDKVTRIYVTALRGITFKRIFYVCFTGYYSVVFPDWPVFPRNRYISLFLIVTPPILILSVIIISLVKHKYPHLVLLN